MLIFYKFLQPELTDCWNDYARTKGPDRTHINSELTEKPHQPKWPLTAVPLYDPCVKRQCGANLPRLYWTDCISRILFSVRHVVPFGSRWFGATLVLGNNKIIILIDSICLSVCISVYPWGTNLYMYTLCFFGSCSNYQSDQWVMRGTDWRGRVWRNYFCFSLTKYLDTQCHLQLHFCTKWEA